MVARLGMLKSDSSKGNYAKKSRVERRFQPVSSPSDRLWTLLTHFGVLLLGAGVMGQFILREAPSYAALLLLAGGLCVGVTYFLGRGRGVPVRVGDLGVGLEKKDEFQRLRWCDVGRVRCESKSLLLEPKDSKGPLIVVDLARHALAASHIIRQAADRIQSKLAIEPEQRDHLLRAGDGQGEEVGEEVPVIPLQVAGKTYDGSTSLIALERDVVRCVRCAALYPRGESPNVCALCEQDLTGHLAPI